MPGTFTLQKVATGLAKESLEGLAGDEGLVEKLARPGSLVELAEEVLDLEDWEVAYLRDIPRSVQEAIRSVIHDVASERGDRHIAIYYTPAYDFSVSIHEFDRTAVVHLHGPYTGQPYARELYKSSR